MARLCDKVLYWGLITAVAGIIAKQFGPGIGGLFLAFPAIFPASATLIEKHEKQKKENAKSLKQELGKTYKKWLDEDVRWIISDEERAAFKQLSNDEERDQFIEGFWQRRDPTPDTIENEFKEEHYARIAYANEHFAAGIAQRDQCVERWRRRLGQPIGGSIHDRLKDVEIARSAERSATSERRTFCVRVSSPSSASSSTPSRPSSTARGRLSG